MTTHTPSPASLSERLDRVQSAISDATAKRGPGPQVTLIGVSKRQPVEAIFEAYNAGLRSFGENYAQEFRDKHSQCEGREIDWHFIGQIQSNKIKYLAGRALIHTIDRASLVEALAKRTQPGQQPQSVLLEINFDEAQKGGVNPEQAKTLLQLIADTPNVTCRGLMTIPPQGTPEQTRPYFAQTRELLEQLQGIQGPGVRFDLLSMGMSADFKEAILEGATHVRVGTAIFGSRPHLDS